MTEKFITVKEVTLNNNCPECYSNTGLQLTFKQKFKETPMFRSITDEIVQEISCNTCNTTIYPVRWTDDIDRVFDYQRKAFIPKETSFKLKRIAWFIIGITIIVGAAISTTLAILL